MSETLDSPIASASTIAAARVPTPRSITAAAAATSSQRPLEQRQG
ncbi:MAG TPA: hypothetical protein VEY87_05480 [Gaiellaceae bacterium]|nr:hypothetical protein [Gaiellaceae bacterium]